MLTLKLAAEGGAGFLNGFEGGRIGAEFHLDRLEGEAEAAIAQLALQQIERFTAPAEAAEHAHRFGAITLREKGAQGRHDRCGCMAPQGGRADQHRIAAADRFEQFFGRGEFAVDALHTYARARHALGQAIGDGGGVAVGTGVEQRHRQLGAFLGFAPAAVVHHQAAPALGNGGAMARSDGADRQFINAIQHRFHLAHHRCHQAVVEVAPVFLGAAAVGFCPVLGAEVSGKELAAHQQAAAVFESHQATGPAGRGGGQQLEAVPIGPLQLKLPAHHLKGGQRR